MGGSRFAMQTKPKIQLLTQLAGSCSPSTSNQRLGTLRAAAVCVLACDLSLACAKNAALWKHWQRSPCPLPCPLDIPTRLCQLPSQCAVLKRPVFVFPLSIFICLSSPVSLRCLCGFRLNFRTELKQTQTSGPTGCQPNAAPARVPPLCHLSALAPLSHRLCSALLPCRFSNIWGFYARTMC